MCIYLAANKKSLFMKKFFQVMLLSLPFIPMANVKAQKANETSQPLSKKATKGMLVDAAVSEDGSVKVTYKMKVNRKSDEVTYEDYVFDKGLVFKGVQPTSENKQKKEDQKVKTLAAFVGGTNSFNVLSMSLNLQAEEWERIWDYDKQTYKWGKRLSKDAVKPRNSESKYRGFAAFPNDDEGTISVIASYDQKGDDDQFVMLYISNDLSLKETKVPVKGSYSLVYCGLRNSGNIFAIFAPNKGEATTKKYVYSEFTNKGDLVTSQDFESPSSNMAVMDYRDIDGNLYLCAGSTDSKDAFNEVFSSYAPISNPGYSTAANRQMDKYEKRVFGTDFDYFHLLRITEGKLAFASTTAIRDFKTKVMTPPSQKKSHPYKGKKFSIENFAIAPNGDFLVTGQLQEKKTTNKGSSYEYRYTDLVCLHFDKVGNLKTQYAVEKINNDRESEVFQSMQNFFFSADGSKAFWEIMEVKGTKGYSSFVDAYNGNKTFTANYFPRVAAIDLNSAKLGDFTVLGNEGKFLMYPYHSFLMDEKTKTRYYLGHDDDYEKVWVGSYTFE
jgi:hypothetical protein